MKTCFKRTAAMLLSAAVICSGAAFPASAADTVPAPVVLKTVCPGYEPLSDDMLYLTPDPAMPVRIELLQHSPERANLLLYESTLTPASTGIRYACAVEPGDYTLRITYSPVKSSINNNKTVEHLFKIENADYSPADAPFTKTEMTVKTAAQLCSATQEIGPAVGRTTAKTQNGIYTTDVSIPLAYYSGERGDYDGNSVTDVLDAQALLKEYVETLSGKKSTANAMQKAICDIDGDGELSVADVQYVLMFYTDTVAGKTPKWPDGAPDHRYPAK